MTALTVYFSNTAATTVTTANQLLTSAPASEANITATGSLGKGSTGWIELPAQGGTATTLAASEPTSPSGNGWLLDATTLEAQEILQGNWTPSVTLSCGGGTFTVEIHVRAWKRSSAGVYTQLMQSGFATDIVQTGVSITSTKTTTTLAATALDTMAFATGDKLYIDIVLNITTGNSNNTAANRVIHIYENGGSAEQSLTPGYIAVPSYSGPFVMQSGWFTSPAALGSQAITGIQFQPKALLFFTCKNHHAGNDPWNTETMIHMGAATSATNRWVVSGRSPEATTNAACCASDNTHVLWYMNDGLGDTVGKADITSLDANGFTLNWTESSSPYNVYTSYLAFGGTNCSALASSFTANTTTGNQSITGVGFKPDLVIFCSAVVTNTTITTTQLYAQGWACSDLSQGANYFVNWLAAPTNVSTYQRTDRCIVLPSSSSPDTIGGEASLVSLDADGFTINWQSAVPAASSTVWFLALKGCESTVVTDTQPTATGTKSNTAVGFQPSLVWLASQQMAAASTGTLQTTNGGFSYGMATSAVDLTQQQSNMTQCPDGAANTVNGDRHRGAQLILEYAVAPTQTITASAQLQSFDAIGYTLNWGVADTTSRQFLALAVAPASTSTSSSPVSFRLIDQAVKRASLY